ncbi:MAG: threonine synthase, partial [Longimicrobiales bacterium]|nr:threonine synthase [Longimicrobiales bacterium]
GLFVPRELPRLPWPPPVVDADAAGPLDPEDAAGPRDREDADWRPVARWAAEEFFPSVDPAALHPISDSALDFPVPLVEVEPNLWVLELFHGPTHAFKDVGARFMAGLMASLEAPAKGGVRTVLVATSGDTGGAVASAFHGLVGYRVVALFPQGGISERQRRQMTTLGGNVRAVAVDGSFDDCQRLVKEAFRDQDLSREQGLTSANSINVGRLLPQAFYYVHAAARLDSPHFFVPAGNLGNLCAGLLAWKAGMPAAGFTAAVNENRGFVDYLEGADFKARPSVPTTSSAMDVGDPSNLERIRWLFGGEDQAVRRHVSGVSVSQEEVARCIGDLYRRTGYVADPHTAVAYEAASRRGDNGGRPRVVLATAHPAKFPDTVEQAIGREVELPPGLSKIQDRNEEMIGITAELTALATVLRERGARHD